MKLTRIALAAASACGALASAPAFAVTADQYLNTGEFAGSTLNIRISGASAQDNGILGSALSLCQAGTVHRYAISNNFVFYCTPDAGTNAGQIQIPTRAASNGGPINKLAIYKYSIGGAGLGVTPINSTNATTDGSTSGDGARLPFLDLSKIAASCTGTNAVLTNPTFGPGTNGSYNNVACSTNVSALVTTPAVSYVGVSDLEPAFFSNKISNINAVSATALIFGPIVTKNVYDRLQTLQALSTPGCGATLDSEGCTPSLSSAQIVSLYTQAGQSWSGVGVGGLADDSVYVARRVNSSGTQKTFESLIARTPNSDPFKNCSVGTEQFVQPDSLTLLGDNEALCTVTVSNPTAPTIFAGAGGGNVRNCLTNHQAQGRSAIGILTTEDKPNASWRFVKVDGVAPNQANTASGAYRFYTEASLNTRIGGAIATNTAEGYPAFVSRLSADFANKAIIKQINGSNQSFGAAGLMALLSRQTVAPDTTPDYTGANSIIPWTKLVGGTTVDNCQAPKAVF